METFSTSEALCLFRNRHITDRVQKHSKLILAVEHHGQAIKIKSKKFTIVRFKIVYEAQTTTFFESQAPCLQEKNLEASTHQSSLDFSIIIIT